MKKLLLILLSAALALSLAACGNSTEPSSSGSDNAGNQTAEENTAAPEEADTDTQTLITLTVGDTVLEAYLNGSAPAQSLIAQLPLTVTLNDSGNDFCGGNLDIDYAQENVQMGYRNGDLAFWTPANNFVIFVSDEENSSGTGNLVILGHITSSQEMLDALEGRIDVTIALAE